MIADAGGGRGPDVVTGARQDPEPPRTAPGSDSRPVFIAGADRSGTTLMFAILASHPNLSMVRRTNMWRYFHWRYGDLGDPRNLDRCLGDMVRYQRMRHLAPDADRIRREFLQGEPTYGRLFALFHEHHAARAGKQRWGDKSLHTEHYADRIIDEFPDARIIHMVRDPRDRYASVRKRHGRDLARVGATTGRWLDSTRAGRKNRTRFPNRYLIVRYEDLARRPEETAREVCAFIGEEFSPLMLSMAGAPEHRGAGNSSFGDLDRGAISTNPIGRFRSVLSPSEIAFIQLLSRGSMRALGYEPVDVRLSPAEAVGFYGGSLPVQLARMMGWVSLAHLNRRRGNRVPPARLGGPESPGRTDG